MMAYFGLNDWTLCFQPIHLCPSLLQYHCRTPIFPMRFSQSTISLTFNKVAVMNCTLKLYTNLNTIISQNRLRETRRTPVEIIYDGSRLFFTVVYP